LEHYEKFCCAVDLLVEANEQFRERFRDQKWYDAFGPVTYAAERATVQVNPNRQAGKTEYIKSRAKAGDLIVVHAREFIHSYVDCGTEAEVRMVSELRADESRYNKIYIDEPWLVFQNVSRGKFYSSLCKDADQTFIFLGRN